VRAEKVRVEANRCNPAGDKPSILPGGHAAVVITTAAEQKFARFLASGFDVIAAGLPRLLRQFKPDGPTDLLLPHCGAIDRGINSISGKGETSSRLPALPIPSRKLSKQSGPSQTTGTVAHSSKGEQKGAIARSGQVWF
jgi:hypothetical protein